MNQNLSLTIPTYNRAEYLDVCLDKIIQIFQKYHIEIYISDNASTDNTQEVVEKWQKEYSGLHYHCNDSNLDMDGNFEVALNLPNSKYVWLFGDTYIMSEENLVYLLSLVDSDVEYDSIVFNLIDLVRTPTKDYTDQNELLCDLSGIMSCVACLVYNKKIIKNASFSRYKNTFFSLEAIIFEYISSKNFVVHWAQTQSLKGLELMGKSKKNWSNSDRMLKIGVEGWIKFLYALPASYTLKSKFKVHRSFGKVSRILTYKGLVIRRSDGALTLAGILKYSYPLILSAGIPKFIFAVMLSLLPTFLFKSMIVFYKKLR